MQRSHEERTNMRMGKDRLGKWNLCDGVDLEKKGVLFVGAPIFIKKELVELKLVEINLDLLLHSSTSMTLQSQPLQKNIDSISDAVQAILKVGETLKITLGYKQENGHIEPVGSFEMPPNLPEESIRAVFYEMLERQQQKELEAFRNLWENQGVEFDYHARDSVATLTLFKEKSLEEEAKPKEVKVAKTAKTVKEKKPKAAKKAAAKKPGPAKAGRGRKGYSAEQKADVLDFVKANPGRGVLKKAAAKFKVSYPTINLWVKGAGISPKAPGKSSAKAAKATKTGASKKNLGGVILLNGVKYVPLASVKPEKAAKVAKVKPNKGLERAIKALDKALAIIKMSV